MMTDNTPRELLDRLADELAGRGLGEQVDFYITGRHPDQIPSSEHIGMRFDEGGYRVWYRDMGYSKTLVESPSFPEAREVFVREAVQLARERGRRVTDERPS